MHCITFVVIIIIIIIVDHNECTADTDNCDQKCHNTKYSYYCTCKNGYKLGLDGHTCIGIYYYNFEV